MRGRFAGLIVALVAQSGCGGPCVQPLDQWCGDPPCDEPNVRDVTVAGQCDDLAVAHDFTIDAMETHVWYFERVSGELVAVHVFSDDPRGSCTSDWYGREVTCATTCELPDADPEDLLECE